MKIILFLLTTVSLVRAETIKSPECPQKFYELSLKYLQIHSTPTADIEWEKSFKKDIEQKLQDQQDWTEETCVKVKLLDEVAKHSGDKSEPTEEQVIHIAHLLKFAMEHHVDMPWQAREKLTEDNYVKLEKYLDKREHIK
jgi:hypothetical protein